MGSDTPPTLRVVRRLAIAMLLLAAVDIVEPRALEFLERSHYETLSSDFRFENSDLFGVGPLVAYLREHPRGQHPRVFFVGNSVVYGYLQPAASALPAQYQRLDATEKVFNVAVNAFEPGSSFLVVKSAVDCIDRAYVLFEGRHAADRKLPGLVPVDKSDLARFDLAAPDPVEQRLASIANRWRLYRDSYRLQAALFGTSTREFLYLHKGDLARALIARLKAQTQVESGQAISVAMPVANTAADAMRIANLRRANSLLWDFGDLFFGRHKQLVLFGVRGDPDAPADSVIGEFNRAFAPYARFLILEIPRQLTFDGQHLTEAGAANLARALWYQRRREEMPR